MTQQFVMPKEVEDNLAYCRDSLYWHTRYVHRYYLRQHQRAWIKALEDTSIKRLLIIAPPKYGKSPILVDYIGRRIGLDPNGYHCIYVSNTARQAEKYSVSIRDTIAMNDRYKAAYGLKPDMNKGWSSPEWFVKRDNPEDKDPTLQACGIYGPILGATVQEVFFDDIADEENMATAYQREKLMEWIRSTPLSRLVPGISRAIMICTRWHEDDPAAQFEKEGWTVLSMPAIGDDGQSTYPEFWSLEDLIGEAPESAKSSLGTRQFELMFQNNVLPEGGSIFKHEWWKWAVDVTMDTDGMWVNCDA